MFKFFKVQFPSLFSIYQRNFLSLLPLYIHYIMFLNTLNVHFCVKNSKTDRIDNEMVIHDISGKIYEFFFILHYNKVYLLEFYFLEWKMLFIFTAVYYVVPLLYISLYIFEMKKKPEKRIWNSLEFILKQWWYDNYNYNWNEEKIMVFNVTVSTRKIQLCGILANCNFRKLLSYLTSFGEPQHFLRELSYLHRPPSATDFKNSYVKIQIKYFLVVGSRIQMYNRLFWSI